MNSFASFFIIAIVFYSLWLGAYYKWGKDRGGFDDQMTVITANTSVFILQQLDYRADGRWVDTNDRRTNASNRAYQQIEEAKMYYISINQQDAIAIGNRCNGLFTIMIYIGFIIAYPGRWGSKAVFIVIGSISIFVSNIIRMIALTYNAIYHPISLEFNHSYTYTFVVYSVVFVFWIWWVNKYSYSAEM
jgi:exosortase/archaeosortase family protein